METPEKYSLREAFEESEYMKQLIASGDAADYGDAEAIIKARGAEARPKLEQEQLPPDGKRNEVTPEDPHPDYGIPDSQRETMILDRERVRDFAAKVGSFCSALSERDGLRLQPLLLPDDASRLFAACSRLAHAAENGTADSREIVGSIRAITSVFDQVGVPGGSGALREDTDLFDAAYEKIRVVRGNVGLLQEAVPHINSTDVSTFIAAVSDLDYSLIRAIGTLQRKREMLRNIFGR